jgi:hypothetical protein
MNNDVQWRQPLKISDGDRSFLACLAEQDGKHYATILYWKRINHALGVRLSSEKRPALNFISHTTCAGSPSEALTDLDRWIKGNLGEKFALEKRDP